MRALIAGRVSAKKEAKDKEKSERTDDSGPGGASSQSQHQHLASTTPTNNVRESTFCPVTATVVL